MFISQNVSLHVKQQNKYKPILSFFSFESFQLPARVSPSKIKSSTGRVIAPCRYRSILRSSIGVKCRRAETSMLMERNTCSLNTHRHSREDLIKKFFFPVYARGDLNFTSRRRKIHFKLAVQDPFFRREVAVVTGVLTRVSVTCVLE